LGCSGTSFLQIPHIGILFTSLYYEHERYLSLREEGLGLGLIYNGYNNQNYKIIIPFNFIV